MQLAFGAGALWGNRTDVTGTGIGPDQFAILQDISLAYNFENKELYGQYQFPLDIARGKGKITVKAKSARIFAQLYGDLFFGSTPTTGMTTIAEGEAQSVPGVSTYTITVTNAVNYVDDLGVFYAAGANAGKRFTRVTSVAAAGQYSVNLATGVYTFYSGDANASVAISYIWNNTAAGKTITLTNQLMGFTPSFKASFYTLKTTQGVAASVTAVLNACMATQLSIPTRIDDYTIPEFDFSAFADASGNIGTISTLE